MLERTHLEGDRIVAVFPCIGGEGDSSSLVDAAVITYDEADTFRVFTAVRPNGSHPPSPYSANTFPKALRYARQALGWG